MKRLIDWLRRHTSLTIIIVAALLLELTSGVMYYTSQSIIERTVERLVKSEMTAIYLGIRNQLAKVEVTVDNMAWVVNDQLTEPDSMFVITRRLIENNPAILGTSITFIPNYYPQKGLWFEPYATRHADGTIEIMQMGSADHDYTKSEFFKAPIEKNGGHWTEPYLDRDGAKIMITTYGVPVYDVDHKIVAVVDADLSLDWLEGILEAGKIYKTTRRYLITNRQNLLVGQNDSLYQTALKLMNADDDQEGYVTVTDDGEKWHVFYHPVGGMTDWVLINILNDKEVFGKLFKVRILLLLLVFAGLAIIGFVVYRTSWNLERLRKVNAEKERISSELHVASQIQQSMLPPDHLQQDGLDIFGSLVPAREVGGDIFDFFLRNEKLFFCIGDVSGKGIPSALVMSVIHSMFRMASAHENNPARIMQTINEASCEGNESNMFVTLFIGILDLPTGHLRYCNAGHDVPVVVGGEALQAKANIPVGLFDDFTYEMQETTLAEGSMLFLYTDGLTEAKNVKRQQFGKARVMTILNDSGNLKPEQLLEKMTHEVHTFVEDAEQSDDLTMLAIRYSPVVHELLLDESLTLQNDVHQVKELNAFVKQVMARLGIGPSLAKQFQLAVEEAVVNVMDYAYPAGVTGDINIHVSSDGHNLQFIIKDAGAAFDPTEKEKADTTLSVEDRPVGGLGILLVRELMDSINYERIDGMNVLTLKKLIN